MSWTPPKPPTEWARIRAEVLLFLLFPAPIPWLPKRLRRAAQSWRFVQLGVRLDELRDEVIGYCADQCDEEGYCGAAEMLRGLRVYGGKR